MPFRLLVLGLLLLGLPSLSRGGLLFNGTTQEVTVASAVVTNEPFTVCLWIYPTTTLTGTPIYWALNLAGTDLEGWQLLTFVGLGETAARKTDVGQALESWATATANPAVGVWSALCGMFFADGFREAVINGSPNGDPTALGDATVTVTHTTTTFAGRRAHIAVWNQGLTDEEMQAVQAGANPRCVRPTALVSYLPFMSAASPQADVAAARSWTMTAAPTETTGPPVAPCRR
jgi:hypothetical protein